MLVVLRDVRLCFLVIADNMIASVSECTCKAEFSFFYKFSKYSRIVIGLAFIYLLISSGVKDFPEEHFSLFTE